MHIELKKGPYYMQALKRCRVYLSALREVEKVDRRLRKGEH